MCKGVEKNTVLQDSQSSLDFFDVIFQAIILPKICSMMFTFGLAFLAFRNCNVGQKYEKEHNPAAECLILWFGRNLFASPIAFF